VYRLNPDLNFHWNSDVSASCDVPRLFYLNVITWVLSLAFETTKGKDNSSTILVMWQFVDTSDSAAESLRSLTIVPILRKQPSRLTTSTMVSYSVTFLPILRKLWVIVLFRVPRLNYGTIFLLKQGVPILLYLLNRSLRHFYLRNLFINTLLFLCIYLFIYFLSLYFVMRFWVLCI